ncbi:crooked neck-like protein 1 [Dorcoceras hygrometricum]|uniref:Crooked neck-like protein 1 n=1 Tax=Dorcoceras hygrometricum TaxID=472368 RepID=A0A2Z7BZI7_9LAMI|nr:crooked neck-like protein 1 [Dorcoceras hygrometricum]
MEEHDRTSPINIEDMGLFQVINHEICDGILQEMFDGVRGFYEQDVEAKAEWYTRLFSRRVIYNSNFDLFTAPYANWRDTVYCQMAPNALNPEELPVVCRKIFLEIGWIEVVPNLFCTQEATTRKDLPGNGGGFHWYQKLHRTSCLNVSSSAWKLYMMFELINPLNYDAWFDYIWLEESVGDKNRIEDVYERAIANIPPAQEKRYWQRYIYLWISYVLYEELDAQNVDRTREVYNCSEH